MKSGQAIVSRQQRVGAYCMERACVLVQPTPHGHTRQAVRETPPLRSPMSCYRRSSVPAPRAYHAVEAPDAAHVALGRIDPFTMLFVGMPLTLTTLVALFFALALVAVLVADLDGFGPRRDFQKHLSALFGISRPPRSTCRHKMQSWQTGCHSGKCKFCSSP